MALVISNKGDWTAYHILDWLLFYKCEVIYQNEIDYIYSNISIYLGNNEKDCKLKLRNVEISRSTYFWLRKFPRIIQIPILKLLPPSTLKSFIRDELATFLNYYFSYCRNMYQHIGSNTQYNTPMAVNKMESLIQARKCGLKIPKTYVGNFKPEIKKFLLDVETAIIKPLSEPTMIADERLIYTMHTKLFSLADIENINDNVAPILLQEYITKKFEIRTFYLKEKFYSCAIFSQNDSTTKIDYRRYNSENPNRLVPFIVPNGTELKLNKLLNILGLNTASIDLIYTPDNEIYFLEVNPVGQFGSLSLYCNYYLECEIAKSLL